MSSGQLVVVLATLNGADHLAVQLASLAAQTRGPDTLVVTDDGSTDATLQIVADFAAGAPFRVKVVTGVQGDRKRSAVDRITANFVRGVRTAGDAEFVSFCDQDDEWLPDKLERSVTALQGKPRAAFVAGDAELMDAVGAPIGRVLTDRWPMPETWADLSPAQQLRFALRNPVAAGATMVVRSSQLEAALPIPAGWLYDRWLSLVGCALGGSLFLAEPVLRYRIHDRQVWGLGDRIPPASLARRGLSGITEAISKARRLRQLRGRIESADATPDVLVELRGHRLLAAYINGSDARAAR